MPRSTFASRMLTFYRGLAAPRVPRGVGVMNPYRDRQSLGYVRAFLGRFFADDDRRVLVFGINPGRFGAGLTGVTFTDPVALADYCGIDNPLPRRRELSSVFIYDFIESMGGAAQFYSRFFLTAVSPLGFTRDGVNLNYYDEAALGRAVTPFIVDSIGRQIAAGGKRHAAIVIGAGANFKFMQRLNEKHRFFDQLHALEHPRFILQYRRRQADRYLARYGEEFEAAASGG